MYPDFDSLPISVMADMYGLSEELDKEALFTLLPIYRTIVDAPHGSILSARCFAQGKGITRGTPREKKKGYMKNCIILDLVLNDVVNSIKIFKDKIHVCGVKSQVICDRIAKAMLEIIIGVNHEVSFLQDNITEYEKIFSWLEENTRGEVRKNSKEEETIEGYLQLAEAHDLYIASPPPLDTFDPRIWKFISGQIEDHKVYEELMIQLKWLRTVSIYEKLPVLRTPSYNTMTNFNHRLGYAIRKRIFVEKMCENGYFTVKYDNSTKQTIKLTRDYIRVNMNGVEETATHTFVVHSNGREGGHITQSGTSLPRMKEVYIIFMDILESIKDDIVLPEEDMPVVKTSKRGRKRKDE